MPLSKIEQDSDDKVRSYAHVCIDQAVDYLVSDPPRSAAKSALATALFAMLADRTLQAINAEENTSKQDREPTDDELRDALIGFMWLKGATKIWTIKYIRSLPGRMGLKEAKDATDVWESRTGKHFASYPQMSSEGRVERLNDIEAAYLSLEWKRRWWEYQLDRMVAF